MGYGNGETGSVIDDFWLAGPLQISAIEQTRFLAKLAQDALPFPEDLQENVREIIQLEQWNNWRHPSGSAAGCQARWILMQVSQGGACVSRPRGHTRAETR